MRQIFICLVMVLIFAPESHGQAKNRSLAFTFTSGFKTGWWIYHKGTSDGGSKNDQGWDRTHYLPKISVGGQLNYQVQRVTISLLANYSWYLEDRMLAHEDIKSFRQKYPVSKGAVTFQEYGLDLSYDVISGKKFALSPNAGIGLFSINTIHPEKDNFGNKVMWHIGMQNKIRHGRTSWLLNLKYQELTIKPKEPKYKGERHKIHAFGIEIGLRYWIK